MQIFDYVSPKSNHPKPRHQQIVEINKFIRALSLFRCLKTMQPL